MPLFLITRHAQCLVIFYDVLTSPTLGYDVVNREIGIRSTMNTLHSASNSNHKLSVSTLTRRAGCLHVRRTPAIEVVIVKHVGVKEEVITDTTPLL